MSDSVGKITLDLEVKSDISGQINEVSNKIANTLKSSLNNSTNKVFNNMDKTMKTSLNRVSSNLKNTMANITNNLKNSISRVSSMLSNIKLPSINFKPVQMQNTGFNHVSNKEVTRGPPVDKNILSTEIDTKSKMLDNINAKIEYQQSKLRALRESYNNTFNSNTKNKIYGQILKTEESIIRLTSKSDKLGFELSELDIKLENIEKDASIVEKNVNKLSSSFNKLNLKFNKSNGLFNKIGNGLKNLASGLNLASNVTRIFNNNIIKSISQIFKWMILYPMIVNGIYAMSSSLFASLKTNTQFVNSLNQIKTNLMVAFMPIYQAILPAINALMRALSVVTQYIASFISALFGKTYKQSFQATQTLINAKDAMGAYGKATDKAGNSIEKAGKKAKKAMGDLMGFDEINKLNMQENPDTNNLGPNGSGVSSNAPILVQPLLDTSLVDAKMKALVDKIKKIMSKVFEPFVNAWRKEGTKTVNSIKYALKGILSLVKSIGTSFLEVWTNGTGEKILIVILQILQNIFNIIGDISRTFAVAWDNNKIGTKIIQGIANTIRNLLTLIKKMSDSFRKAWEVVGLPLANTFMDILDSTIGILENLSEKFIYVWDHGGSHLFESLIKLGGKILEISGYIYNNFVAPFINWFVNMMAPAIAPLMDALGSLFDKFSETIDWLLSDGKPVLDIIISLVGGAAGLAGAFKAAKKGIEIFDGIKSSAERLGKEFVNLDPKALLIKLAIAAIIGIGIYLITHWNEIKAKCKEVWENVQKRFQEFKDWLGFVFATDWSKQFGWLGDILNGFFAIVKDTFNNTKQIFKGIIDFITGIFTGNWRKAWNGVRDIFKGIMGGLGSIIKSPLNAVISLVNAAISGLNKISVSIPDFVPVFGGKKFGFNIPKIPYLAKGGIIDSPTLAMVGEAGKEAVMPLENNTGWITDLANKVADRMPRGESNGNSSIENITIQVGDDTLAKILLSKLKKIQRQTGETVFKV